MPEGLRADGGSEEDSGWDETGEENAIALIDADKERDKIGD